MEIEVERFVQFSDCCESLSLGVFEELESANAKTKCGGLSTARRTMKLSVASVEMTHLFGFEKAQREFKRKHLFGFEKAQREVQKKASVWVQKSTA